MAQRDTFIAVDWGTTNRRAYLVGSAGEVLDEMEDALGVTSIEKSAFPAAIGQITGRWGDRPLLLLAGMIGSNRGLHETAYVPCPARLQDLAGALDWIAPGRVAIVPGLSFREGRSGDVMRGEEVQAFGLLHRAPAAGGSLICHPGTHTKWITVRDEAVTRFSTVMTGELFSLLREHSILAPLLQEEPQISPAFLDGVTCGHETGLLSAELFAVRAKVLLSLLDEGDAASYASGLLIGCDLKAGLKDAEPGEIMVQGRPSLTRLYAAALRHCGREARETDGADDFVAGMAAIREMVG